MVFLEDARRKGKSIVSHPEKKSSYLEKKKEETGREDIKKSEKKKKDKRMMRKESRWFGEKKRGKKGRIQGR